MTDHKHASKTIIALCVASLLALSQTICLAEVLPSQLTVAAAISIALRSNARLKQSHADYASASSRLKVEKMLTTYDVGTNLRLRRSEGESDSSNLVTGTWQFRGTTGTQASIDVSPYGSGTARGGFGIELRKPLGAGRGAFSSKADSIESARVAASMQYKDLFLSKQSTVQDVVQSYYGAVLAREKVKVVEGALANAKQAAEDARKRLKEELIVEIDVARADIRVAQTEDQLNQQRQQARSSVDGLMLAMGMGVGQNPELIDPVPEPKVLELALEDAIKKALANRVELSQYDTRITEQQRKLALRGDRLRPRLDAVAGFDSRNADNGLLSSSLVDSSTMMAGIEYRIPLDSRSLVADRETAVRDLDNMRSQRELQTERISEGVRDAYRKLDVSKATLEIFTENLKVAETSLKLATRMFEEGLRDNRNVLDSQQDLARIKNDILAAKTELYLAGLNLKYAIGEDLISTEAR